MCDVGYLCANFKSSLASVLESGPMYMTDVRQKHRLMPPPYKGGGIINQQMNQQSCRMLVRLLGKVSCENDD